MLIHKAQNDSIMLQMKPLSGSQQRSRYEIYSYF